MSHHSLQNGGSDGPKERWRESLFGRGVTDPASFGQQHRPTPARGEGARLLSGDLFYSLQLLTSGLPNLTCLVGGGAARHTPVPRSVLDHSLGRSLGFATSGPTPNPVLEAASQCQLGLLDPSDNHSALLTVGRTFRKRTQPLGEAMRTDREEMGFFFPSEVPGPPAEESILDLLSVGSHLGSLQCIVLLLRLVPAFFPLSCLQLISV